MAKDAPPEKLRGLREGWVYWYVGCPVVHPDTGEEYTYMGFERGFERVVAG